MNAETRPIYEFGPFRLDVSEHLLTRDGVPVPLTPKVLDILLMLVDNSGHLVTKDELISAVWPDTSVEEGNLNRNISVLRKALGETPQEPRYVETVPKRGYRFTASVRRLDGGEEPSSGAERVRHIETFREPVGQASQAIAGTVGTPHTPSSTPIRRWVPTRLMLIGFVAAFVLALSFIYVWPKRKQPVAETPTPIRSIAVLPLKNLGSQDDEAYLGVGLADALITKLIGLRQLSVRPTSAVLKYSQAERDPIEVGQKLKVDAVLDGAVQKVGERIRITVQLMSVRDGTPLWAQTFDEHWSDIFAVQDAISTRVTSALAVQLTRQDRSLLTKRYTGNTEAYELYLKAGYLFGKRTTAGAEKAREYYRQAIELDPQFALAYAGLARTYVEGHNLAPKEAYQRQKELALKALEIDDSLAEAHAALAFAMWRGDWDWNGAGREFQRSVELNPGSYVAHLWFGLYLASAGQSDKAVEEVKRALEVNPTSLNGYATLGAAYLYSRQYDEAIEVYKKALELDPSYPAVLTGLGWAYAHKELYEESIATLQKALTLEEINKAGVLGTLGYVYARAGKRTEAAKTLDELDELQKQGRGSWGAMAVIYTGLNDKDQAFYYLEKALEEHEWWLSSIKVNPSFDNLRSDPRFDDLLRRTGLTP